MQQAGGTRNGEPMGSIRRKRRKKLKKSWAEFQAEHNLSDEDLALARSTGIAVAKLKEKVAVCRHFWR